MTLSERTETIRKYAQIIFTKGSHYEQIQFLKNYKERYNKHWNFEQLQNHIEVNTDNMATIDKSIENIKQLNKII